MNVFPILHKYLDEHPGLYDIVCHHSMKVAEKSLEIARNHPELGADRTFLEEAALLHDIGVFMANAPKISCFGPAPYICHGYLGREILDLEDMPKHGLVCERHIGTGLTVAEIERLKLPLPHRDMSPVTIEEQIICFADLFYSKGAPGIEKTVEAVRSNIEKYGTEGPIRFDNWCNRFL